MFSDIIIILNNQHYFHNLKAIEIEAKSTMVQSSYISCSNQVNLPVNNHYKIKLSTSLKEINKFIFLYQSFHHQNVIICEMKLSKIMSIKGNFYLSHFKTTDNINSIIDLEITFISSGFIDYLSCSKLI